MSPDRYAVIGDPIDHSLSPELQRAAFRAAGIDATYERIRVARSELSSALRALRDRGYRGFNVTVPHKQDVMSLLDDLDSGAVQVGAVNTVVRRGNRLVGHNTDIDGFSAALDALRLDRPVLRATVLGAGGAARAVVAVLVRRDVSVTVLNRTPDRAARLAGDLESLSKPVGAAREPPSRPPSGGFRKAPLDGVHVSELGAAEAALARCDLLVNATSLGMGDYANQSPLPDNVSIPPETMVIDLVYGRETPFLQMARRSGCRVQDGIEMLVAQGAAAFRLWTGVNPDIGIMRHACLDRLAEVPQ
jgi:shikimate dehydrogenase